MNKVRILVVQNEHTSAIGVQNRLKSLGYAVPAVVSSGKNAIEKAAEISPDLVLMDMCLKGDVDSVQAAECIRDRFGIPVIYLTTYMDESDLRRARVTEPFGCIFKPFGKQELRNAIEMTLHKHRVGREGWSPALSSIDDVLVAGDKPRSTRLHQETVRRLREAETLGAATSVLTRLLDMEQVLESIVKSAIWLIPASTNAVIYLLDQTANKLELEATAAQQEHDVPISIEAGIANLVVKEKQLINVSDPDTDPRSLGLGIAPTQKSLLAAPLIVDNDCIGALGVNANQVNAFTVDDERLLTIWATQAAVAIRNARLHREVQRRVNELSFLDRIGRAVTSSLDPQQILTTAMEEATRAFKTEAFSVLLRDEESSELVFEATIGPELKGMKGLRLPPGEGVVGWVAEQGQPSFTNEVGTDPRFCPDVDKITGFTTRSVLAVPLKVRGNVIGVMEGVNKTDGTFDQADVELLSAMAQWVAIAVHNAQLFLETQNRYEELERTQAQLVQSTKMAAVGQLAAGVAHDFNNLLTVITGLSDLLICTPDISESTFADLRMIRETADRAASLTKQLLAFSRKQVLQPRVLDLNVLVTGMEKMLRRLIGEDIALDIQPSPTPGMVKVDPGQIEQVVMNLVVNAHDAMPKGGKLSITVATVALDGTHAQLDPESRPGTFACLSVTDTGVGMDENTVQRIFEPFFTTKGMGRGTGLGLSVIYGIVRQHEGWITVHSKPGSGSTFQVYLPICAPEQADRSQEMGLSAAIQGRNERIL
ncbi:MAG: GAF domain-containing protein, partial [Anaerolineae bacterium]|nr:GAF domain-containing protein [Anaerolineae bacterium]